MYLFKFESRSSWEDKCPPGQHLYETLDDFKEFFRKEFKDHFIDHFDFYDKEPSEPSEEFLDDIIEELISRSEIYIKAPCDVKLKDGETVPIGYSHIDYIDGKPFDYLEDEYTGGWDMRFRLKNIGTPRRR